METLRRREGAVVEGPVVLVVMDGVGIGRGDQGDAVALARTPVLDRLRSSCPGSQLRAHGTAVGLPSDSDMGNSEVGHNALGAGRVFDQGAKLVNRAIETGAIFEGEVWREVVGRCHAGGSLHLVGLLSDGNVHSHIDQLFALIRRAAQEGVERLCVHPLLDGRDVPETSALVYVDALEGLLASLRSGTSRRYLVASGGGRMIVTMDRYEADWRVVERGWRAHVLGEGRSFSSAREAIETLRSESPGVGDQFLPPFVIAGPGGPVGRVEDGDSVVFFNFRGDRAIEISRAFEEPGFDRFDRVRVPRVLYAGMMQYDGDLQIPRRFLVQPPRIERPLTEYLVRSGVAQLAAAETQKFGHVTYFWNGNNSGLYDPRAGRFAEVAGSRREERTYAVVERSSPDETYLEVPSDQVPFEQRPWMKAAEVTDAVIAAMRARRYGLVRVNYANGDMVGHTGDLRATIVAVEAVDLSLGRLLAEVAAQRGAALVLADHGNADEMLEIDPKTGRPVLGKDGLPAPKTSHSLSPVPFLLFDPHCAGRFEIRPPDAVPGLANVAASALTLLGFEPPEGYEPSLIGVA